MTSTTSTTSTILDIIYEIIMPNSVVLKKKQKQLQKQLKKQKQPYTNDMEDEVPYGFVYIGRQSSSSFNTLIISNENHKSKINRNNLPIPNPAHKISPISIIGAFGAYANIINGRYIPVICSCYDVNNNIYHDELIYKNIDILNTNKGVMQSENDRQFSSQIQYCNRRRTWKIITKDGYTVAQMKTISTNISLDNLICGYWETVLYEGSPFELQISIQIVV